MNHRTRLNNAQILFEQLAEGQIISTTTYKRVLIKQGTVMCTSLPEQVNVQMTAILGVDGTTAAFFASSYRR